MITIPIEELLKNGGSVYKAVILAAKRATELNQGLPPLVKIETKKNSTIALEEIRQGLTTYRAKEKEKGK